MSLNSKQLREKSTSELLKLYREKTLGKAQLLSVQAAKARAQMRKKVSGYPKPFVYRLGYNHCIGQWAGENSYPALSGSSLNRKKPKKKPVKKKSSGPAVHYFSPRSRGKVKDKATAFYRSVPGDRVFLTLTFVQHVDDALGNKILNKFLTVVRKEIPGFVYLRVAEHQPENPKHTIHFHTIMNKKLPVARYNALWVLQQYNAGLRGRDRHGREITMEQIQAAYDKGHWCVQRLLNPLDVRRAYGINALASYLTKYVTKQKAKDPFGCLSWHCSRKVSRLFTREVVAPSTFSYLRTPANYRVDKTTGECFPAQLISKDFYTMVYVNNKKLPLTRLKMMEQVNKWIIDDFDVGPPTCIDDDIYRKIFISKDDHGPPGRRRQKHIAKPENYVELPR